MRDPSATTSAHQAASPAAGAALGSWPRSRRLRVVGLAGLAATSLLLAACSSSSGGAGSGSASSSPSGPTGASTREGASVTAGKAAGKKAGAQVALPKETVGNILFQGSDETTQRIASAIKIGAADLGWKYIQCDGQGTPTLWASCANTLMNEGANVMISAGIDPSVLEPALHKAKSKGVLFFNTEALVPPGQANLYAGNYAPAETDASDALAAWVIAKLKSQPADRRTVAMINYNAVFGLELRSNELAKKLQAAGIKVVAQHTLNFANVTNDSTSITDTWLSQYPHLGAIFSAADAPIPVVARAVAARDGHVQFPKRPLVFGFLDSLENLQAIRNGSADAVVSNGTGLSSLVALDEAAEYFARKTAPTAQNAFGDSTSFYGLPLNQPTVITSSQNLPAAGSYATSRYDVLAFFKAKWATEFTTGG